MLKQYLRIPEEFDKWRLRYCKELFADVFEYAKLNAEKAAFEICPGSKGKYQILIDKYREITYDRFVQKVKFLFIQYTLLVII